MTSAVDRLSVPGRRRAAFVAAGLVVLAVGALVVLLLRGSAADRLADAESDALDVARERAAQMTTYSAETFREDARWATTGATPSFAEEYAAANEPIGAVVEKLGARAEGEVTEAAATAVDEDEVEVLLFVDQTVVRGAEGERSTERNRVLMTMVRRDGAWLVDDVALR